MLCILPIESRYLLIRVLARATIMISQILLIPTHSFFSVFDRSDQLSRIILNRKQNINTG